MKSQYILHRLAFKAVYLNILIQSNAGIYRCASICMYLRNAQTHFLATHEIEKAHTT